MCNPKHLQAISDYSMHAPNCCWRLPIITIGACTMAMFHRLLASTIWMQMSKGTMDQSKITQPSSVLEYDDDLDIQQ
jgi:hypothetical protein